MEPGKDVWAFCAPVLLWGRQQLRDPFEKGLFPGQVPRAALSYLSAIPGTTQVKERQGELTQRSNAELHFSLFVFAGTKCPTRGSEQPQT